MKAKGIAMGICSWLTIAIFFGLSMYRKNESILPAIISGFTFSTLFFLAFTICNALRNTKLNRLLKKYGMSAKFVEICDKMMKKEKNGLVKTQTALFLAEQYHRIGDNKSAINVIKANVVIGALSYMTELTIYNNLMFYYLMEGDIASADEIYATSSTLMKSNGVKSLPAAFLDTYAVREYMHGNYEESLRLLGQIKVKQGTVPCDICELHMAWNYVRMGRKDEASEILRRLSEGSTEEYVRNQASGLLHELESSNVTQM